MRFFANIRRRTPECGTGILPVPEVSASAKATRRAQRKRGTILIFVVAILALLAVMGTTYLLMARMDRTNTRIESEVINMDYGRDAILNMVREIMFDSTLDSSGNILSQNSRYYDYPDPTAEPWLAHYTDTTDTIVPPAVVPTPRTMSAPSLLTPMGYDPSTNKYDIPLTQNAYVMTPFGTNGNADGDLQLLSYSTPGGVRFRFAVAIEDSCSRANLNVGCPYVSDSDSNIPDPLLPYGAYYSGNYMGNPAVMASGDNVLNIHSVSSNWVFGRQGPQFQALIPGNTVYTPYNIQNWQLTVMTMELPNKPFNVTGANATGSFTGNGSTGIIKAPNNTTAAPTLDVWEWLYDLSDELEMRSFGIQGLNYIARLATAGPTDGGNADKSLWPNTCGANKPFRDLWTSYSWVRNNRGSQDPTTPYTFNGGQYIWPTYPRKIGINQNLGNLNATGEGGTRRMPVDHNVALGTDGQNGSNYIPSQTEIAAMTGVNIATAMQAVGFTASAGQPQPTLAFAINYMTYRTESGVGSPVRYQYGPAWMDSNGIHVPTSNGAATSFPSSGTDLQLPAGSTNMYMGYIAQPYLTSATVNGTTDCAVQLTNSYPYALDTQDYRLLTPSGPVPFVMPNPPNPPTNLIPGGVPGNGGTVTVTFAGMSGGVVITAGYTTPWLAAGQKVELQRTYNNGANWYTVDTIMAGNTQAVPNAAPVLYDRYNDNTQRYDGHTHIPLSSAAAGGVLYNITDFNRIGRICDIVNSSGTDAGTCMRAQSPQDSTLHFDFLGDSKAIALLDYIDTTNRTDDPTIIVTPGLGYWDISKLRLPGRINVNTAMLPVLESLPGMTPAMASSIISSRPMTGMGGASGLLNAVKTGQGTTFDARDQVWGDIFNACTTRSDTFVVYGYMEAVRPNPAALAAGTFNNGTSWYDTTNVTDDPNAAATNPNINLIRVSRRRFLAVIDRSFSNLSRATAANTAANPNTYNWSASPATPYIPGSLVIFPPTANGTLYQCVPPLLQSNSGPQSAVPAGTPPTTGVATSGGPVNYQGPYYYVPIGPFQLPRVVALKDMPY